MMMIRASVIFPPLAAVVFALSCGAGEVTRPADSGPGSLREAITAAVPGETITFAPGLSGAVIVLTSGQLVIDRDLTIDASGLGSPVAIDGNGTVSHQRVLRVLAGATATLDTLVITGGRSPDALDGNPDGGGIHNAGILTIRHCTIHGNSSGNGGGEVFIGGNGGEGGGIYNTGDLVIEHSIISGNTTGRGGDGIGSWYGYDDDYYDHHRRRGSYGWGGYYGDYDWDTILIEGRGGLGGRGGGIANAGVLTLRHVTVADNATGAGGDGVDGAFEEDDDVPGPTPQGGAGGYGGEAGGVHNSGTLSMDATTIRRNFTGEGGHGANGTDGVGGLGGGMVQSGGAALVERSTIAENTTADGSLFGGSGSGLFVHGGNITLRNTTVARNRTGEGGFRGGSGAGIFHFDGRLTIENSTVSDNATGDGLSYPGGVGGIYIQDGTLRIENSIVAGNHAGSGDPDFERGGGSVSWVGGNLHGGDPELAPLGFHGGPTRTMPPRPGSPAIDAARTGPATPATDQRGMARVLGARPDLGAVESGHVTGYQAWTGARIPPGQAAGFGADADGNGMANGVEYACGSDGGLVITRTAGGGELRFGYRPEAQSDARLRVMRSNDCRSFTEVLRIAGGEVTALEGIEVLCLPAAVILRDSSAQGGAVYYRIEAELAGP